MHEIPTHDLTGISPVIHDPANGIFAWDGQDSPLGEFQATTVGDYLITYFQPHEAGRYGCVQVYFGKEIQFAATTKARDLAERFAEMVAKNPRAVPGAVYARLPVDGAWVGAITT